MYQNKWIPIILFIVLLMAIAIPVYYTIYHISDEIFLSNFMGNYLATIIGIIVGIPIGFMINRWQQELTNKSEYLHKQIEESQRKKKILKAIRTELVFNKEILENIEQPKDNGIERVFYADSFKDEIWRVFTDGGEIEWIRNSVLLSFLANAYYYIRVLMNYESLYKQNRYFPSSTFGVKKDSEKEIIEILCIQDKKALNEIYAAITYIDNELEK